MRSVLGTDVMKSPHKYDECIPTSFTKVWNLWRRLHFSLISQIQRLQRSIGNFINEISHKNVN